MSDYSQVTDFSDKDALTTGDPEKAISGADVDGELSAISTAIASKVDEPTSPATNDKLIWSGSAWAAKDDGLDGDAGQVRTTDGTVSSWAFKGVVQQVIDLDGAVATGTIVMPDDDTVPQQTEGDEYLSVAITPKATAHLLEIDVHFYGATNSENNIVVALFQDSTADALAAGVGRVDTGNAFTSIHFKYRMTAGTTSATTFKVRAGGVNAGTVTFNGQAAGRSLGGVMASSLTVTELAV